MTRAAWGKAKHEIYAIRKDILSLLTNGENLEAIYQHFKAENIITVGKRTFKRHAAIFRDEALKLKNSESDTAPDTAKTGAVKRSKRSSGPVITPSTLQTSSFAEGMRKDGTNLFKRAKKKEDVME